MCHTGEYIYYVGTSKQKLQQGTQTDTDLSYFRVLLILQCVVLTQHTHLLTTVHWEG